MPNTKRRFADDDPESDLESDSDDYDDDDDEPVVVYRGGGKQLPIMRGKQLQLRPSSSYVDNNTTMMENESDNEEHNNDDDDDDDDDDNEESYDDEQPIVVTATHRSVGGGKHFRPPSGGGKQLRVIDHDSEEDDDEEDDDDDDDDIPVQPVSRSGGKSLFRPPPQDDDEDEDDDEEMVPIQIAPRMGKSLTRMRPPGEEMEEEEDDDDDDGHDDNDEPPPPPTVQHQEQGQALMGIQSRGGGKQLRPPPPQQDDDDDDDDEEDSEEDFEPETPMVVTRAPQGGGKQLRPPTAPKSESEEESDDDDDMDIDESSKEEEEEVVKKKPARGRPKGKTKAEPTKKTPSRAAKNKAQDMEESSDESSDEERELDMETFDTQALVENEEDQKYLDSLPEFEREAILGERFEKLKAAADMKKALRESKRKERELRKKESAKKKPAAGKGKKKVPDTSEDADLAAKLSANRESTRNRDAAGTKAKKDAARAKLREERRTVVQQKEDEEMDEDEESDLQFESEDDDSDEDYEETVPMPWQEKKKKKEKTPSRLDMHEEPSESSDEEPADEPGRGRAPLVEAELEDYMRVTLPRRRLARWSHEPFFDRAVTGCFVRLFIGESEDGKKCYRLCEIVDVDKSKSEYKFPAASSRDKPVSTSKALKLRFGKNEKVFPMYLVSDSRPTDEDVAKYVSVQKSSRQGVLGKKEASMLRKKQDQLVLNYTYTEADIEKNISERKRSGKALTNLGLEQTRVAIAVQAAQSAVEDAQRRLDDAKRAHLEASEEDSKDLEKALDDAESALTEARKSLEEKKEDEKRVLAIVEKRKQKLQRRQNWAKVNERAAKMNQTADFQSYKDQQAKKQAETSSGAAPRFNPYARRKVKPKILWEVGQKEEKKDDDATKTLDGEMREAVAENGKGEDQPMNDQPQENILATQKAAFIGERHQFSIDEEALAPDTASILGTSRKKQKTSRTRKGLSLAEYQVRKTAGTL